MSETNVATPKPSLIRKAIGFLVRSAIVLGVVMLFALAAQRFVDSTTIFASIPSNFQWQYLLAGIGLLAFSLCLRFRAGVVLAALFVLFQLPAFWPYYFGGVACEEAANIRVGVANVYGANRHFRQFGEWVAQEKPDVLLLQETNEKWPAYLEEFKTEYPHHRMMTIQRNRVEPIPNRRIRSLIAARRSVPRPASRDRSRENESSALQSAFDVDRPEAEAAERVHTRAIVTGAVPLCTCWRL